MKQDISKISNIEFLTMMYNLAHPIDDPSAEYAWIMDEAARRIKDLEEKNAEKENLNNQCRQQ